MASMDIGGDDSVMWAVDHGQDFEQRQNLPKRTLHVAHPNRHAINVRRNEGYAEGRDPVMSDGKLFRISIKLPADPAAQAALVTSLRNAQANASGRVTFELPIEAHNHDQIHVEWAS